MVLNVKDLGEGGRRYHNSRSFLSGSGPGSPITWHGDVCGDPTDSTAPGEFPSHDV